MTDLVETKEMAWSYSRLHGFELCPRRYHETQVLKNWPEEESAILIEGNAIHAAMAKALRDGTHLPTKYKIHQHWVDKILQTEGELLIEEDAKWAITRQFKPTTWFSKTVWLRCIADAVKLAPPKAGIVDWKWGKSINADPLQLTLTSLMLLTQFPELNCVESHFVWLQEDDKTTQALHREDAADAWAEILPRVKRFEEATIKDNFPPQPGRFCARWCPVQSCEYWGK
jgi:hypothetical protein